MDTESLLARLRADLEADAVEHADDPDPRLGRAIASAVRIGRRRRRTGRLLATTATAAASVAVVGTVSALAWPLTTLGERSAEPAGPPTSSASARATTAPTSADPQPLPATGQDVIDTLSGLLPPTFAVSHASDFVFPQNYEMHVGLTVTDDSGSAWVGAGIDAGPRPPCGDDEQDRGCSTSVVDGVTLSVQKITNSKACDFTRYEYDRPTGGSVWFGQVNTSGHRTDHDLNADCDHKTTRPREPLTDQQVKDLLTDPAWDPLFAH